MISFPVSGPRGRYLLKLDPPQFPHLVANEAFFLHTARTCGLSTASARIVTDRDGRQGLLVERSDRRLHDGALERLAQEDGCQVPGRYPADKYRLSAEQVVHSLSAVTAAPRYRTTGSRAPVLSKDRGDGAIGAMAAHPRSVRSPTASRLLAALRVLAADAPTTETNAEVAHHPQRGDPRGLQPRDCPRQQRRGGRRREMPLG